MQRYQGLVANGNSGIRLSCLAAHGGSVIDPIAIPSQLYDASSGSCRQNRPRHWIIQHGTTVGHRSGRKRRAHLCGSASFVCIENEVFILTATHVWNMTKDAAGVGLTLDKEDVDHRFLFQSKRSLHMFRNWCPSAIRGVQTCSFSKFLPTPPPA